MQSDITCPASHNNVINLFTGKPIVPATKQAIVQICPETSGIKMLYANHGRPDRLISVPILCWGMRSDGETVGVVPWVGDITDCTTIDNDFDIHWEGYYKESTETIFSEPPEPVVAQLTTALRFINHADVSIVSNAKTTNDAENQPPQNNLPKGEASNKTIIQEIPDLIGTHALILNPEGHSLTLTPVVSWALDLQGKIHGMLVDEASVEKTPVIPGDECLYYASSNPNFCCYFQRDIADQIRLRNPDTIAAIEKLLNQQ